jgi:hypothetical protein
MLGDTSSAPEVISDNPNHEAQSANFLGVFARHLGEMARLLREDPRT